ncbi:hypothetical protein CQW23_17078 [Capsicum baccatum]|uniref:SAM domain-containing protein n=1 Tax=Capsicum baccatum TaxID=33114 RepID=A0A2G2WCR4_CAPBA|nr:hypothetical protein CQW23_17078 [Capsicum baccatum]
MSTGPIHGPHAYKKAQLTLHLQVKSRKAKSPIHFSPPHTLPSRSDFATNIENQRNSIGNSEIKIDSFLFFLSWELPFDSMSKERPPEPLDFFIWTVEDVGLWLEEINLGGYRQIFKENGVNGEYLEGMSMFTTEQILRFIRRCHMKWGDFITLCKELRRIKVACLKGEQKVRRPWWAPSCLSVVFMKMAKRNRQSRVVSLKLEP